MTYEKSNSAFFIKLLDFCYILIPEFHRVDIFVAQ